MVLLPLVMRKLDYLKAYNIILYWDWKSVEALYEAIVTVRDSGNVTLASFLPAMLRDLGYRTEVRYDLHPSSEDPSPLVAIDIEGKELYGPLDRLMIKDPGRSLQKPPKDPQAGLSTAI